MLASTTNTSFWFRNERFVAQFNTNVFGVINVTRALLPHFREKRSGIIVYTGSLGGIAGEGALKGTAAREPSAAWWLEG